MNHTVAIKIETILQHAQPAIRDELARHLRACGFTDPDDPVLIALVAQSMIAGQPVRLIERDGAGVATEAGLAMLGNRLEEAMWSVLYPRWWRVTAIWLVSVVIVGAGVWTWMKFNHAPDARILLLKRAGADLQVEAAGGTTYIYFKGDLQPAAGKTRDGRNYLNFSKK
jgi:hypothetical protein